MKKSTILFTVLVVAAFLVATVLGLQNPNLPENQSESLESSESVKDTTISYSTAEPTEQNFSAVSSLLGT